MSSRIYRAAEIFDLSFITAPEGRRARRKIMIQGCAFRTLSAYTAWEKYPMPFLMCAHGSGGQGKTGSSQLDHSGELRDFNVLNVRRPGRCKTFVTIM